MDIKKYDQFINEAGDDDMDYLDKLLGGKEDPRKNFKLPDGFNGGSNVKRPKNPGFKPAFEPGDPIIYINPKSDHHKQTGKFVRIRDDGKFSLEFDDGTKFAANGTHVEAYTGAKAKKDSFVLHIANDVSGIVATATTKGGDAYGRDVLVAFPELTRVGFSKGATSNSFVYKGDLTIEELIDDLNERDFIADNE